MLVASWRPHLLLRLFSASLRMVASNAYLLQCFCKGSLLIGGCLSAEPGFVLSARVGRARRFVFISG